MSDLDCPASRQARLDPMASSSGAAGASNVTQGCQMTCADRSVDAEGPAAPIPDTRHLQASQAAQKSFAGTQSSAPKFYIARAARLWGRASSQSPSQSVACPRPPSEPLIPETWAVYSASHPCCVSAAFSVACHSHRLSSSSAGPVVVLLCTVFVLCIARRPTG